MDIKCLCCETIIQDEKEDEFVSGKVRGGYGSEHDFQVYEVTICDRCVTEKLHKGAIIFVNNLLAGPINVNQIQENKLK